MDVTSGLKRPIPGIIQLESSFLCLNTLLWLFPSFAGPGLVSLPSVGLQCRPSRLPGQLASASFQLVGGAGRRWGWKEGRSQVTPFLALCSARVLSVTSAAPSPGLQGLLDSTSMLLAPSLCLVPGALPSSPAAAASHQVAPCPRVGFSASSCVSVTYR